jgi:hypothetical protein
LAYPRAARQRRITADYLTARFIPAKTGRKSWASKTSPVVDLKASMLTLRTTSIKFRWDYVLTGGELPPMTLIGTCVRLLGVMETLKALWRRTPTKVTGTSAHPPPDGKAARFRLFNLWRSWKESLCWRKDMS